MKKRSLILFVFVLILCICLFAACKDKDDGEVPGGELPNLSNEYQIRFYDINSQELSLQNTIFLEVASEDIFTLKILIPESKTIPENIFITANNEEVILLSDDSFVLDGNSREQTFDFFITAQAKGDADIFVTYDDFSYHALSIKVIRKLRELEISVPESPCLGSEIEIIAVTTPSDAYIDGLEYEIISGQEYIEHISDGTFKITGIGTVMLSVQDTLNPQIKIEKEFSTRFAAEKVREVILSTLNIDGQDGISSGELQSIKDLEVRFEKGKTTPLTDIQALTALEELVVYNGNVGSVDLSGNKALKTMTIDVETIGDLTLHDMSALKEITLKGSINNLSIDTRSNIINNLDFSALKILKKFSLKNLSGKLDIAFHKDNPKMESLILENIASLNFGGKQFGGTDEILPDAAAVSLHNVTISHLELTFLRLLEGVEFENISISGVSSNYLSEDFAIPSYVKKAEFSNWANLAEIDLQHADALQELSILFDTDKKLTISNAQNTVLKSLMLSGIRAKEINNTVLPFKSIEELTVASSKETQRIELSCGLSKLELGEGLNVLSELALDNNSLSSLDLSNVAATLTRLSMQNNKIVDFGITNKIKVLDLSGNKTLATLTTSTAAALEELNVSDCQLNEAGLVSKLVNLKKLNISNNRMELLDDLLGMKKLKHIDISHNALTYAIINEYFGRMKATADYSPEYIDYSGNAADAQRLAEGVKAIFDRAESGANDAIVVYSAGNFSAVVKHHYKEQKAYYEIRGIGTTSAEVEIAPAIKQAHFRSVNNNTINYFSIKVLEREQPIDIYLNNFKFTGSGYGIYAAGAQKIQDIAIYAIGNSSIQSAKQAIYSEGKVFVYGELESALTLKSTGRDSNRNGYDAVYTGSDLMIDSFGTVSIYGADGGGGGTGQNGGNGGNAITCGGKLYLNSPIELKAGNGGHGGRGADGSQGGTGDVGGTGGTGAKGKTGGNGGKAGYAFYGSQLEYKQQNDIAITAAANGKGGDGGTGGTGGKGGKGSDGNFFVSAGNGGNGGKGGNGGNGGNAYNSFPCYFLSETAIDFLDIMNSAGEIGRGGAKGAGGAGGDGGSGFWASGKAGDNGAAGDNRGADGVMLE